MSELADELARHAQPERVKGLASEKVSEWKERAKELATEKAGELKEHAKEAAVEKATEIKTRAKEAVMHKTMELKEQADTPRGWSLLGAILGAGVGAVLMKKAFTLRQERYDSGFEGYDREGFRYRGESYPSTGAYPGTAAAGMSGDVSAMGGQMGASVGGGMGVRADISGDSGGADLKGRAAEVTQSVKGKAHELKERAWDAVGQVRDRGAHLRERIPSGGELKGRATDWFDQALERQPLMLALGSIAVGVFASMFIPVSARERQLIEPAKRKAQEGISQLGEQLEQKLQGSTGGGEDISRESEAEVGAFSGGLDATGAMSMGSTQRTEDLMGAERPGFQSSEHSEPLGSPTGSRIPPLPPLDDVSKIH
jgi:hypothetical protein